MRNLLHRQPAVAAMFLSIAFLSVACGQSTQPTTAPAATQPAATPAATQPTAYAPIVADPHLLIISIDGLRPDCLLRADAPNLRGLMARGSFSLWARTTDVAITTPSHVSMLTGVTPETHGINFNGDPPDDAVIKVPTIFDLAKEKGLTTGLVSGKRKFSLFGMTGHLDWSQVAKDPVGEDTEVGERAAMMIEEHKPQVMFVHFPGADRVGHGIGWGTPAQIAKIGQIDQQVGVILRATESAALTDRLYIIVSADHGGTNRSHGKEDVRSRYIPWIAVGPGVRHDYDLTRQGKEYEVATYDTFATGCYIMGITPPETIIGKPVMPIFEELDLMSSVPGTAPTSMPAR